MYQTIQENVSFELVEKKSKFIANIIYVDNKIDAEIKIKEFKKIYYDARHNCVAYRVLENENIYERFSDDGEPSGTAGGPILNILQKNNLCNILVIVTRYFGGILLGTGGLVRCYSGATIGAMKKCNMIQIESGTSFEIKLEYQNFQILQYYFQKNNIKIINKVYGEVITCIIEMSNISKEKFLNDLKKKEIKIIEVKDLGNKYIKVFN